MRKSQLEMYVDILEVLDHNGQLKLKHIMNKVNVNCSVLKECLDLLTKQGLVEVKIIGRGRKVYAITQLGITVFTQFKELRGYLAIVEEPENEAKNKEPVCFSAPRLVHHL